MGLIAISTAFLFSLQSRKKKDYRINLYSWFNFILLNAQHVKVRRKWQIFHVINSNTKHTNKNLGKNMKYNTIPQHSVI